MPTYKLEWTTFNGKRFKILSSEAELRHDFDYCVLHAFNGVTAYIDDGIILQDPIHGWNTNCAVCEAVRERVKKKEAA